MRKTLRAALVAIAIAATLVYTLWGSLLQGEDIAVNINFWGLISIPFTAGVGAWWVGKAGR